MTRNQPFRSRIARVFSLIVAGLLAVTLAGCGSSDADEPASYPGKFFSPVHPQSFTGVQSNGAGGGGGGGTTDVTSNPGANGGGTASSGGATEQCSLQALNSGRFAGTGLRAIALVTDPQCPLCSSGESCTTLSGQCLCILTEPTSG